MLHKHLHSNSHSNSHSGCNYTIKEINVLVDSRSSMYGDECEIDLNENVIYADKNQLIRINLTYFNMYNNLHGVNFSNGNFKAIITYDDNTCDCKCLTKNSSINFQNYYSIHEIASEFAVKLGILCEEVTQLTFVVKDIKNTILNLFVPFLVNGGADSTPGRASNDGNHLMDISLQALNGVNHNIIDIKITFEDSDLYLILGGLKNPENETSLLVTINNDSINVKGYFPMQRFSDNNICLRCNVIGNSLASPVSINGNINDVNSIHYNADILGIFNTDSEMIEYINSNNIFSGDVREKYLKHFKLFLTDSKNKKLIKPSPLSKSTCICNNPDSSIDKAASPLGTAAGLQDASGEFIKNQNTQGNLNFKALLNIELIQLQH